MVPVCKDKHMVNMCISFLNEFWSHSHCRMILMDRGSNGWINPSTEVHRLPLQSEGRLLTYPRYVSPKWGKNSLQNDTLLMWKKRWSSITHGRSETSRLVLGSSAISQEGPKQEEQSHQSAQQTQVHLGCWDHRDPTVRIGDGGCGDDLSRRWWFWDGIQLWIGRLVEWKWFWWNWMISQLVAGTSNIIITNWVKTLEAKSGNNPN